MATKVKRNKINFNGKMVSIGIDIHKRSWHITALADGKTKRVLVGPGYRIDI